MGRKRRSLSQVCHEKGTPFGDQGRSPSRPSHPHTLTPSPSPLQSLPRAKSSETLIALHGQYSDVFIMDSITLDVREGGEGPLK